MKKFIKSTHFAIYTLLCAVLLTGCKGGLFVWTLRDVGGLIWIGILLIIGLLYLILVAIDKIKAWWRGLFKK